MKLAAYVRVSTLDQVENGNGLDIQAKAISDWAADQGYEITEVFADEGISGKNDIADRPGLADAIASVKYNGNEGLVVVSLDRLARTLTVQEGALASVWNGGGQVYTVDQGEVMQDDPEDPVRTMVRQILGAVSQFEAASIKRRLMKGRQAKAEAGGYIGGNTPYGYRSEAAELVPDPQEQRTLKVMAELRKQGTSYRGISRELMALGFPPRKAGQWYPNTVRDILLTQGVES